MFRINRRKTWQKSITLIMFLQVTGLFSRRVAFVYGCPIRELGFMVD